MATKYTGWDCEVSASVDNNYSNDKAKVTVSAIWRFNNWNYNINYIKAWVTCNGSETQVMNNGSVNGGPTGTKNLGSATFYVNKTKSSQSIKCGSEIHSNGTYLNDSDTASTTVTVSAKPSYTVKYDANGGSGAPGNQTKWYGEDLTLSTTKPTRTGYTFNGWYTAKSGGSKYGTKYTSNAAATLYAQWTPVTYTVTYNANGGSGQPGNQTKTYGVNLTLSTTKPTRTGYTFAGWSTTQNGSATIQPKATYSTNANLNLYAVWELAYIKPRITNFSAFRCNAQGNADEAGTYIRVKFNWATDLPKRYIKVVCNESSLTKDYSADYEAGSTSGSLDKIISGFSIETTYQIHAYVEDTKDDTSKYASTSVIINIPTASFPIDVKANGNGVAFGKVAETDDLMDVNFNANFRKELKIKGVNIFDVIYPVGSIYMSVNNTNPSSLFGGTWVAWGSGKVPVGVNTSDTNFNTVEKTGGNSTVNLEHSHTSAKHTHTLSSHTHSLSNHTHTSAKHTHGRGNLEAAINYEGGSFRYYYDNTQKPGYTYQEKVSTTETKTSGTLYGGTRVVGTTGETTPGATGTPSNNTSGTPSNNTSGETTPGNTGTALSTTQSILQPYITCYMWKRTA